MDYFDDYLDDVLDTFFNDPNGVEILLDNMMEEIAVDNMIDADADVYADELDDIEPSDDDLIAIETEIGKASI